MDVFKEHSEARERNGKGKSKVSTLEGLQAQAGAKGGRGGVLDFQAQSGSQSLLRKISIIENPSKNSFDNTNTSFRSLPLTTFQVSENGT